MPAPRAVLISIHELGLDPEVAHCDLDKKGHLRSGTKSVEKIDVKVAHVNEPKQPEQIVVETVAEPVKMQEQSASLEKEAVVDTKQKVKKSKADKAD